MARNKGGTGIYARNAKGETRMLTAKEVREYIKETNHWTQKQYEKQYDILRNKLRNFENYQASQGKSITRQSTQQWLYREAKSKNYHGPSYKPSIQSRLIKSFSSISSGKSKNQSGRISKKRKDQLQTIATLDKFGGLIAKNPQAQLIADSINDPVKRDQALADFVNQLNLKITEEGIIRANEAIPSGQTFGSTDEISFDISKYQ
jgi:hypothetical protein